MNLELIKNKKVIFSFLFVLIIVLHYWWSLGCNILIILTFLICVLNQLTRNDLLAAFKQKWIWVFSIPFLLTLIGFLYSEDTHLGGFMIEKRLSIFLFPILFFALSKWLNRSVVMDGIVLGGITSLLGCFTQSLYLYQTGVGGTELFYSDLLAYPLYGQAVYLSFMINTWIVLIVYQMINKEGVIGKSKLVSIILIVVLLIFHFLLASRMSMLVLLLVAGLFFVFWGVRKIGMAKSIGILSISTLIVIAMAFIFPKTLNRFRNVDKFEYNYENKSPLNHFNAEYNELNWTGITVRLAIWNAIVEDLKFPEAFIGKGSGDVESTLLSSYTKRNFHLALEHNFNTHNQYLDFLLSTGVFGMLFLLGSMLLLLVYGLKTGNYVFAFFVVIVLFTMMTENILNRNMGIVFYAFVSSFLFWQRANIEFSH